MRCVKLHEKPLNIFTEIAKLKQLAIFDFNFALNNNVEDIAVILAGMFADKWDSILAYSTQFFIVLQEYGQVLTETINDNGKNKNTRQMIGEVSAYNDTDFVNQDKDTETNNGTTENIRTRKQVISKINPIELEAIKNYLQSNVVYDTIYTDVNSVLTLSIFSLE